MRADEVVYRLREGKTLEIRLQAVGGGPIVITCAGRTRGITGAIGLLVRGPSWTPEVTEETKQLQEGHMANINRLADLGKLVLAGPFGGGGDRRGVFIFKGTTLEEAQALTDTDPAVQAGRLQIRLYPWRVPRGVLP